MDAPAASSRERMVKAIDRRNVSSFQAELGIIVLLLASGVAGLVTSSAVTTVTMFVGGVVTWVAYTVPEMVKSAAEKRAAAEAEQAKEAEAEKAAQAAKAPQLPGPDATLQLIRKRRSVYPRDYSGERVPREQVEKLLEAANWAPTHGQTEPWRFIVLEGSAKTQMEDLTLELCRTRLPADKAAKTMEKMEKKRDSTWGKISCYIAVCCKRRAKPDKLMPEWEEMAAVSCAVQNMALLATSMGIAAYWTSWQEVAREAPEMKALLGVEPEDRVMGFFTVGRIERERLDGYRGSRGPWQDKVTWRS